MGRKRPLQERECGNKVPYMCIEDAWLILGGSRDMNAYLCSFCGAWHNGHFQKSPRLHQHTVGGKGINLLREVIAYARKNGFIVEKQRRELNQLINERLM